MFFSRDIGEDLDFSKYDQLAIQCNTLMHSARFAYECTDDVIVDQAGDGRVVSTGISKHRFLILHDWRDHYMPYVDKSVRIICLGDFAHPTFRWKTVTLESYPIPEYFPVPINKGTILVAGDADSDNLENIVNAIKQCHHDTKYDHVTIAIRNDGFEPTSVSDAVENVCKNLQLSYKTLTNVSKPMIELYYRSAAAIVHCGSSARGQLHSIAMQSYLRGIPLYYGVCGCMTSYKFCPSNVRTLVDALK